MMKKLIYIVAAIAFFAISDNAMADKPKESPKAKREARQMQQAAANALFQAKMGEKLESKNFVFYAEYLSAGSIIRHPVDGGFREVFVGGDRMVAQLPYISTSLDLNATPLTIDFLAKEFDYSYELKKGVFYVRIAVHKMTNQSHSMSRFNNTSYTFDFAIYSDGVAQLTVTPNYTASITYDGRIN